MPSAAGPDAAADEGSRPGLTLPARLASSLDVPVDLCHPPPENIGPDQHVQRPPLPKTIADDLAQRNGNPPLPKTIADDLAQRGANPLRAMSFEEGEAALSPDEIAATAARKADPLIAEITEALRNRRWVGAAEVQAWLKSLKTEGVAKLVAKAFADAAEGLASLLRKTKDLGRSFVERLAAEKPGSWTKSLRKFKSHEDVASAGAAQEIDPDF